MNYEFNFQSGAYFTDVFFTGIYRSYQWRCFHAEGIRRGETLVKPIPFSSLEDVRIGNAQDDKAKTGVTVICFPKDAKTGVDISGGGPASRETPVLDPIKENIGIHAIVFSGGSAFTDSAAELYRIAKPSDLFNRTNTTIGAIITNGNFDKAELTLLAVQTRNAYARSIRPVGTLADGDTIYAASCGKTVEADLNMAGTLAADVMQKAIENAILASKMDDTEYLSHCRKLPVKK